jgi:hypothetical protein
MGHCLGSVWASDRYKNPVKFHLLTPASSPGTPLALRLGCVRRNAQNLRRLVFRRIKPSFWNFTASPFRCALKLRAAISGVGSVFLSTSSPAIAVRAGRRQEILLMWRCEK